MKKFLIYSDKILTAITYAAYVVLLIYVLVKHGFGADILKVLLIPASGFIVETILRDRLNFRRPYEVTGIPPIIPKDKKGHSFPSRHAFSVTMIAMMYLYYLPYFGIVMLVIAAFLCVVRVKGGVHFARDVLAGAALAAGYAAFFMYIFR
ncbi:MAG: PAP2 family protein [Lachnospiraceae bacterium]|uniref:Phosphatase PAP2 family protein n=1 Tax=Candidatus Weimeria bifida TaxID=2599074 RepID=A0A6N7IYM5_9FIRM|nr:phosphatase PAP2 family protein [Candidatus Weimeria bifida]RRF97265.1 MAG: PAP2 family protein [Lachnospiraceae bacterium]